MTQRIIDQMTEMLIRSFLWQGHGHDGLYGDDGEMQCGECRLDYKRAPLEEVVEKARVEALANGLKRFAAAVPVQDGTETTVMRFKMIVDNTSGKAGHQKFRTEGWLNTELEKHLAICNGCRHVLAKDLRDFAGQVEALSGQAPVGPEPLDFEGKLFNLITEHGETGLAFSGRRALTSAMLRTAREFIAGLRIEPLPESPDFGKPGERGFTVTPAQDPLEAAKKRVDGVLRHSPRPNHLGGLTMTPDPDGEWIKRSDASQAVGEQ